MQTQGKKTEETLYKDPLNEQAVIGQPVPEVLLVPPVMTIKVARDNLVAYMRVKVSSNTQEVTPQDILDFLKEKNVKYGIQLDEITNFCTNRLFYQELVAARGLAPSKGIDGKLVYFYDLSDDIHLQEKEDGTVNYRELGLVQNVYAGDLLCQATEPIEGADGVDVFGTTIPFTPGNPATLPAGENTTISDDGFQLLAAIDGCFAYKSKLICVEDVYIVKGDVCSATGNLNCAGSVLVHGDVREGFCIEATKGVIVKGMVEGATIIAGGDITISSGMNGMNIGKLISSGDIVCKYIENTNIDCKANVYADVIMNSRGKVDGSIILRGKKSSLIGGSYVVGTMVYAATIGSHTNVQTVITLQSPELQQALANSVSESYLVESEYKGKLSTLKQELAESTKIVIQLSQDSASDIISKSKLKMAMMDKSKIQVKIDHIEQKIQEAKLLSVSLSKFKVVVTRTCFTGTRINFDYLFLNVEDDRMNTKFFCDGDTVIAGQVLPSDKI